MTRKIESGVLGTLVQDDRFEDWWISSPIRIPLFEGKPLPVTFMGFDPDSDPMFLEEADAALREFLKKGTEERKSITDLVYKNCTEFLAEVDFDEADEALQKIEDPFEIWKFVYPGIGNSHFAQGVI